jgi:hypothetical protein
VSSANQTREVRTGRKALWVRRLAPNGVESNLILNGVYGH